MAGIASERWGSKVIGMVVVSVLVMATVYVLEKENLGQKATNEPHYVMRVSSKAPPPPSAGNYHHVWPRLKLGWKPVVGATIGFLGAAFGSVGGVGGGGIFVPMLTLIVGFDQKSSTALSKCMITGAAASSFIYNLRLKHPTLDAPLIDYDLALLFQPMLMLGISIGVSFNVIFADWMITILLIIIFLVMSTKATLKGVETWKKETIIKKEAAQRLQSNGQNSEEIEVRPPGGAANGNGTETKESKKTKTTCFENIYWKELAALVGVWCAVLAFQIAKSYTKTCSPLYWVFNVLQIPVTFGVSGYEAFCLYKGRRVIKSKGESDTTLKVHQLILYCASGVVAGIVGGLLGLGGGFILGPLFLELGIPPQVSSATATFAMTFSSSMSVVEYYLLKRFPVPYALFFFCVSIVAAVTGQFVVTKVITFLGRASLIIFILALTIFVSAVALGGVGIAQSVEMLKAKDYMGFESLCAYQT